MNKLKKLSSLYAFPLIWAVLLLITARGTTVDGVVINMWALALYGFCLGVFIDAAITLLADTYRTLFK